MKNKFNFNDKDDFLRLERLTYDGTLDYSDFPPPEYKYFSELRKIYHAFKFDGLSQESAERMKKSLVIEYRKYLENFTDAVEEYRNEMDVISAFLASDYVVQGGEVKAQALYAVYCQWCSECNEYKMPSRKFGLEMSKRYNKVRKTNGWNYQGISLDSITIEKQA